MAQEGGEPTMAQILQALLADRQLRETELTEEHRRREEEAARREEERLEDARRSNEAAAQREAERQEEIRRKEAATAQRESERQEEIRRKEEDAARREDELRQEFRRREEESARREDMLRKQMEMLKDLVVGIQEQGEKATLRLERGRDVKVAKLTEDDDIEAYLTTFERLMQAYEVSKDRWSFKLAPQLVGKAQQAYAAMLPDDAKDYTKLKEAVLRRYDITEESYRQRFRSLVPKSEETNREVEARLTDLANKWLKDCTTATAVIDQVILEQLLNTLPQEVRVWVRERKPKTSAEASQLADDYIQARKQNPKSTSQHGSKKSTEKQATCDKCGKVGHQTKDCWSTKPAAAQGKGSGGTNTTPRQGQRNRRDLKDVECFNCHQKGHFSSNCPSKAMLCRGNRRGRSRRDVTRTGVIEGKKVQDILLDTGCSKTLIHRDHVPAEKMLEGEAIAIQCAHGDTVLYPLAELEVEVDGHSCMIKAAVADRLPHSMLLGLDVPLLRKLPAEEIDCSDQPKIVDALVVTRAGARKQREEEEIIQQREEESGAQPTPMEDIGYQDREGAEWMAGFDDELFQGGREKQKLTRSQKRQNRKEYHQGDKDESQPPRHGLDISAQELKILQETDITLEAIRAAALGQPSTAGVGFYTKDGLLYRRWTPPGRPDEGFTVEQLVLPLQCRKAVLKLAHDIPLAGHLGKYKTARRVLQRFYWPTLYKDVADFCRVCPTCQKTSPRKPKQAPMKPLPILDVPFKRIAMDIVGPLPRSRLGNRYILVVCDYATRYPEAVALKSIDAGRIAKELITLFARVGIPEEILTDQGSNFTSQLLSELYKMLHVHPIRTSPYHPQTDGLVERFNQTLKAMLRKAATQEGKDWDKMLPYLLFAYREVPQVSTGFAPFELLYGRTVHGPHDVLRHTWEASEESVVSHLLSGRDKMEKMTEIVQQNLTTAQDKQKRWYDANARQRQFEIGGQVLILLPTSTSKLLAEWQGPYQIVKKVGEVNYQVDMHDKRKRKRILHVNMLRPWCMPTKVSGLAEEILDLDLDDVPVWKEQPSTGLTESSFGEKLSEEEIGEVKTLLGRFEDVIKDVPGRTELAQHQIRTGDAQPIRLPPYRIPHAYRETVKKEIPEMLQQGLIEPSSSDWSAPVVLVKKDGSMRLCVDYRHLNGVSEADAYPMPRIDELIDRLGKSSFISTIDLTRGYWQVPVAEQDRPKTAFATPQGLYAVWSTGSPCDVSQADG